MALTQDHPFNESEILAIFRELESLSQVDLTCEHSFPFLCKF